MAHLFDVETLAKAPEASKVLVVRLDNPTDRALSVMQWITKDTKTAVVVDAVWKWLEPVVPHDPDDFTRTNDAVEALLTRPPSDAHVFDVSRSFRLPLWLRARLQLVSRISNRNQAEIVRAAIQASANEFLNGRDLDELEREMSQKERQELGDLMDLVALTTDAAVVPARKHEPV